MSRFKDKVLNVIKHIPPGRVMSYGQVALYTGTPRAARQVGWILRLSEGEEDLPWWRVINNEGRISIKGNRFQTPEVQKTYLEAENVAVTADLNIDIEQYRYFPNKKELSSFELEPKYLDFLIEKYSL